MKQKLSPTRENFNSLVVVQNGQAITTSLQVAKVFQKRHDRVMRTIRNILPDLPDDSRPIFGEATYLDDQRKPRPLYKMNRDGFTLVAMSFTGKPALQFKIRYIEAFNAMEKALAQRHEPAWIETRASGKIVRRLETDAIRDFIEYARKQGSQNAERYYANFTRLVNAALGLLPDVPQPVRDFLPPDIAAKLAVIEAAVSEVIQKGIHAGEPYRTIFQAAKARVFELATVLTPVSRLAA